MTNKESAGLYARVSGDQQEKEDTIASQFEAIMQRIASDGLECDPGLQFVDDAYTGSDLDPPCPERIRTKPRPVSSIGSTSSIRIGFHANMHIKF